MTKESDRFVTKRSGGWAVIGPGALRASKIYKNQEDAIAAADRIVKNQGGGEVNIQSRNTKFRRKKTMPHGNDQCPPKDKT